MVRSQQHTRRGTTRSSSSISFSSTGASHADRRRRLALSAAVLAIASAASVAVAADGTWIQPAGGAWTDAANWAGGAIAGGADATANFNTLDVSTVAPVTLASEVTIGNLTFGDTDITSAGGWRLSGSNLTLAGTSPTITTNALAAGSVARIDNILVGTNGYTITGPGTLQVANTGTVTGNITLNNGNLILGGRNADNTADLFGQLGTAGATLTLSGTNTISSGYSNTTSTAMEFQQNIVVSAGSTTTINMGNRTRIGQTGTARTVTGSGNLNLVLQSNVTRNDLTANFTAYTGTITFKGQQVNNTAGDALVSPTARMLINGGQFGAGFTNAKVVLSEYAVLQAITNSGGNAINIGELSGDSATSGFIAPSAGAATLSIGGLNTNSTFAGLFVGNNIITKVGTGTLTLTSSQFNTNVTNVNAGTLKLSGAGALPTTTQINLANGATLDVSSTSAVYGTVAGQVLSTNAGSTSTIVGPYDHSAGTFNPGTVTGAGTVNVNGNLTLGGSGVLNMELSPNLAAGGTNDLINVSGTTTLNSGLTLNLGLLGGLSTGTYTILTSAGGFAGDTSGWTVNFGGRGAAPAVTKTANALQVNVSSVNGMALTFTGAAGNGNWDINTTTNFKNSATNAPEKFFQLDSVRFDDTAATQAVTLVSTLAPASVVVDTAGAYTFGGSGAIVGGGSLTKRGTGSLTISNTGANTYSGGTTLEAGTLDIGTLGQNGIGSGTITLAGGTLRAITPTGGNVTLANAINVSGTANFITANSGTTARQTILGGAITGSGSLNITNDNAASFKGLDIANTSGFTGTLTVNDNLAIRFTSATNGNAGMNLVINGSGGVGTNSGSALVIPLRTLSGNGTLRGHQSSGGGSTVEWQIGGADASSTFDGTVVDGMQGTTVRPVLITKTGTGTLTLNGANTYTGATTVKGGTLKLSANAAGPVLGNATVTTPGGADIQGGKLVLSYVDSTSRATEVQTTLDAGYDQATKFSSGLLRSTTITSDRVLGWRDNTAASQVEVAYTRPGDADLNFKVEFADLLTLAKNYNGTGKVWAQGDFDYSGTVAFADLLTLAKNYNQTVSAAEAAQFSASFSADFALAQSLVPEPTSLSLIGLGAAGLLRRRRA